MTEIVGVKFNMCGRMYYFSPGELVFAKDEGVIVETARGTEYGIVTLENTEVSDDQIVQPLKKVVRKASDDDIRKHDRNMAQNDEAKRICREKIREHGLEMKLIDVEYTYDNNKIIFYFTADGRVDFRELVVDLASIFHMRIELRQVGVRDEARMLGGIGCCGKSLCCSSWMRDFQSVSIKMAKTQNLSLNPSKISGVCGRLLCCLNFENDTYKELKKGMPSLNERVQTEKGLGKAVDTDILRGIVKVRLYSGEVDRNGNEKLDSDIYEFKKGELRCLGRGTFADLGEVGEFIPEHDDVEDEEELEVMPEVEYNSPSLEIENRKLNREEQERRFKKVNAARLDAPEKAENRDETAFGSEEEVGEDRSVEADDNKSEEASEAKNNGRGRRGGNRRRRGRNKDAASANGGRADEDKSGSEEGASGRNDRKGQKAGGNGKRRRRRRNSGEEAEGRNGGEGQGGRSRRDGRGGRADGRENRGGRDEARSRGNRGGQRQRGKADSERRVAGRDSRGSETKSEGQGARRRSSGRRRNRGNDRGEKQSREE
ncbi:MAG: regulatory iron-sulfur-containing complex subunit RicT [Eubacteriales bacterium]|nr:regulatory iron-sulfur-containing complex subunit RicT [Eubacteriales bacterium]